MKDLPSLHTHQCCYANRYSDCYSSTIVAINNSHLVAMIVSSSKYKGTKRNNEDTSTSGFLIGGRDHTARPGEKFSNSDKLPPRTTESDYLLSTTSSPVRTLLLTRVLFIGTQVTI